jgi:murein DD-endopeptidase MepM/ murein hydrolase activator NlpD
MAGAAMKAIPILGFAAVVWGAIFGASQIAPPVVANAAQEAPQIVAEFVSMPAPMGGKARVTEEMAVNAGFYATGSPAWASQGGVHYGVDYGAPQGSPVYMPFDCVYTMTGHYDDPARMGDYVMCHFMDGYEYYSGHLQDTQPFAPGQVIPAGTLIGFTNEYAHSHIQLRDPGGALVDFEAYWSAR